MKTMTLVFGLLALVACAAPGRCRAELLVAEALDQSIQGDDPGHGWFYELTPDLTTPISVRFDGHITGFNAAMWNLRWTSADGVLNEENSIGIDFTAVGHPGELPIHFVHEIGYMPSIVEFTFEGGSHYDELRLVGDFSINTVPEPGAAILVASAIACAALWKVRRRLRAGADVAG